MKVEERSMIDLRRLVRKREVYLSYKPEVIVEDVGLLGRILGWARPMHAESKRGQEVQKRKLRGWPLWGASIGGDRQHRRRLSGLRHTTRQSSAADIATAHASTRARLVPEENMSHYH